MKRVRIHENGAVVDVATGKPLMCPLSRVPCGRDCALFDEYTESIRQRDHGAIPLTKIRCLHAGKDIAFSTTTAAKIKTLRNRPAPPPPPQP